MARGVLRQITSVPHQRCAKQSKMAPTQRLKPYTLGRLHIGRAPAGMLYVLVWNSVFYRDLADLHFPYSLQSSMCKCSAHRFAKLSIRGTVGFYFWGMLPFFSI